MGGHIINQTKAWFRVSRQKIIERTDHSIRRHQYNSGQTVMQCQNHPATLTSWLKMSSDLKIHSWHNSTHFSKLDEVHHRESMSFTPTIECTSPRRWVALEIMTAQR